MSTTQAIPGPMREEPALSLREKLNGGVEGVMRTRPAANTGDAYKALKERIHLKVLDMFDLAVLEALAPDARAYWESVDQFIAGLSSGRPGPTGCSTRRRSSWARSRRSCSATQSAPRARSWRRRSRPWRFTTGASIHTSSPRTGSRCRRPWKRLARASPRCLERKRP